MGAACSDVAMGMATWLVCGLWDGLMAVASHNAPLGMPFACLMACVGALASQHQLQTS